MYVQTDTMSSVVGLIGEYNYKDSKTYNSNTVQTTTSVVF